MKANITYTTLYKGCENRTIEIVTLEDLLALIAEEDCQIIIDKPYEGESLKIEVYNDYRE